MFWEREGAVVLETVSEREVVGAKERGEREKERARNKQARGRDASEPAGVGGLCGRQPGTRHAGPNRSCNSQVRLL